MRAALVAHRSNLDRYEMAEVNRLGFTQLAGSKSAGNDERENGTIKFESFDLCGEIIANS